MKTEKFQTILVSASILGLAIMFGCAAFQDAIVPCYISPDALDYADANATTFLPWTTLFDARRIDRFMDFRHLWIQAEDNLQYNFLKGLNAFHIRGSEELKTILFSPTGPIGLAFPALAGGALGTYLFSKPKDKRKIAELEKENKK
ncbi:hypothetical protein LCGC14_1725370 [marine sediment metagenome]|uniref:Lipoprotein n=1 Tax=marine sediment metagenome TaxID=412755 RepID=A0A0F9HB06_9ZZZZ